MKFSFGMWVAKLVRTCPLGGTFYPLSRRVGAFMTHTAIYRGSQNGDVTQSTLANDVFYRSMAFMRCSRISPGAVRPSVPCVARVWLQFCLWRTMIRIDIIRCSAVQHLSSGKVPGPRHPVENKIEENRWTSAIKVSVASRWWGLMWRSYRLQLDIEEAATKVQMDDRSRGIGPCFVLAELVGCEQSCWQAEDACNSVLTPTSW
jgi:hypothetical protein